jgi:hypothetical protein
MDNCLIKHNNVDAGTGWLYLWLQEFALDGHGIEIIGVLLKCLDLIQKDPSTIVTPSHELQIMCVLYMTRSFLSLVCKVSLEFIVYLC